MAGGAGNAAAAALPAPPATATSTDFRFQLVSDLHLEFSMVEDMSTLVTPVAPYLIVAGDTVPVAYYRARLDTFLASVAPKFRHVFVIAGNHEYYNPGIPVTVSRGEDGKPQVRLREKVLTCDGVDAALAASCAALPNVSFLQKSAAYIDGKGCVRIMSVDAICSERSGANETGISTTEPAVCLLGCTLWSAIPPHARISVTGYLADYKLLLPDSLAASIESGDHDIKTRAQALDALCDATHAYTTRKHEEHFEWLMMAARRTLRTEGLSVVVVTHHTPSFDGTSAPMFRTPLHSVTTHGFSTALEFLFAKYSGTDNSTIAAWCFGHTHFNMREHRSGTLLTSNQRGYVRASSDAGDGFDEGDAGNMGAAFNPGFQFQVRTDGTAV
ncbi:hypothetical protein EON66_00700 [archaeon]|nr:MAG: hypothetical protein EON66_00700 [archaeon]